MADNTITLTTRGMRLVWSALILVNTVTQAATDKEELKATRQEVQQLKHVVRDLVGEVNQLKDQYNVNQESTRDTAHTPKDKLTLGGYGDVHANFTQGSDSDKIDFHRLVLYLGYEFADWIKFHSETELEHAWTDDGYLLLEQAYVDFLLSGTANIRAGRVLAPVGIINKRHEPTLFNGVERPNFSKYIIPTTWSLDGVGVFGSLAPSLHYEAYVVAGLDGDSFSSSGIRGGRLKGRQSLNDVAVTGRLDYFPWETALAQENQSLRLGVSGLCGGLDNVAGGGGNNKGGDIALASADFEYSVCRFDFRGVVAHTRIDGAQDFGGGVADAMFGWYLEAAYHCWPNQWKTGKLAKSDATTFVRYEEYDTQYDMPSGMTKDQSKDIDELSFGVNFYPVPNFVVKVDYQIRDNATGNGMSDLFNIGTGWTF
jgi:hypothetical protein